MSDYIYGQTLIQHLEEWAPKKLAFDGDRIGCQIGTLEKPIRKVMVTLDVLESVVDEAIKKEVDLIISHHAVIYRSLKNVRSDVGQGRIVTKCIKHDIAVYNMHTNFDVATGGMNDLLADAIGLTDTQILQSTYSDPLVKLVIYVPESHADQLRRVLGDSGAGNIGNYSHCTFSTPGIGRFLPGDTTEPFIGTKGKLEHVQEERIETVIPQSSVNQVITRMLKAHPYEEVAYDLFLLQNQGEEFGVGKVGELPHSMTLEELALDVKRVLHLDGVRITGAPSSQIHKAAVLGGAGSDLIPFAKFRGADVLLTGDIDHHAAQDAMLHGLCLIDIGHHAEKIMIPAVSEFIEATLENLKTRTTVIPSETDTNPFKYL